MGRSIHRHVNLINRRHGVTGSYTYYTTSGTEYEYAGTGSGYFSLLVSIASSATSSPYLNIGLGCSVGATSDSCSVADAATGSAYTGALNSTSVVPQSAFTFGISGGTLGSDILGEFCWLGDRHV